MGERTGCGPSYRLAMTAPEGFRQAPASWRAGLGAVVVLVLAALAATVGIGVWQGAQAPVETIEVAGGEQPAASPAPTPQVYVHVDGAVAEPGLYVLGASARLVDAIAAAGGFADDAERSAVNLARTVADGEQIRVPVIGEDPPVASTEDAAGTAVDINRASATELESLPGIGPALAQRIIAWRETEGPFGAVDDLLAVSGIGPSVLEGLREMARV